MLFLLLTIPFLIGAAGVASSISPKTSTGRRLFFSAVGGLAGAALSAVCVAVGLTLAFGFLFPGGNSTEDLSLDQLEKRGQINLPPSAEVVEAKDVRSNFNGDGGLEAVVEMPRSDLNRALRSLGIYPNLEYKIGGKANLAPKTSPPYPNDPFFQTIDVPAIERHIKVTGPNGPVIVDLDEPHRVTLYFYYSLAS